MANSVDYRQVAGVLSISLSGIFLLRQIFHYVKTNRCHPKFNFPKEFNITHNANHWSNEEKTIKLINTTYVKKKKRRTWS